MRNYEIYSYFMMKLYNKSYIYAGSCGKLGSYILAVVY